jgi:hypothetical protein
MPSVADQIRAALAKAEQPAADISRATGIHRVNLSQFKSGRRDLPLSALELLADHLGYQIIAVPKAANTPRKKRPLRP